MFNKYSRNRAKIHFLLMSFFEKISIFFEKKVLFFRDCLRFFKIDKYFFIKCIKELLYVLFVTYVVYYVGLLLFNNNSLIIVNDIDDSIDGFAFIINYYNQFLLACLGVGGVLIGLFLSNLSSLFAAKYTKIVSKVSISVLNEFTNRKYLQTMIHYFCIIIIQLLFWILNIQTNFILAVFTVFLTIRIIIIYFELTKRIFLFSDINKLTKTIYQEINVRFMYLNNAINRKKSKSIFNSYGNQIMTYIGTLKELQKYMIQENSNEDLVEFTFYIMAILVRYSEFKNSIPHDSMWFRQKYEAVNWFEADFYEINIRTQTGTMLDNKVISDNYFLENTITEMFIASIDYLIDNNKKEDIYKIINNYHLCLDEIIEKCGDFRYWSDFNKIIDDKIIKSNLEEDDSYEATIDFLSLNKISILLKSKIYYEKTYNDFFCSKKKLLKDNFSTKKYNNIFFNKEPVLCLIKQLKKEKNIEKKYITTDKYIYDYLSYYFIDEMNSLLKIIEENYNTMCNEAKKLCEINNKKSSCIFYSRILEYEKKTDIIIDTINEIYDNLIKNQFNFTYKKININNIKKIIKSYHYSILLDYAKVFLSMKNYDYKEGKIDFCGEIFYTYSESLFVTLLEDDYDNFEKIYDSFVAVCAMAEDFLFSTLNKDYNPNYLISKYKIPVITYMDLNGYIIYHSHLTGNKKWENKIKTNFKMLGRKTNQRYFLLKRMAAFASADKYSFDMNELKLNMKQRYARYLMDNNMIKLKESKSLYFNKEIDCKDDIVRRFTKIDYNGYIDFYYKFYELFLIYYVNIELNTIDKYNSEFKAEKVDEEDEE